LKQNFKTANGFVIISNNIFMATCHVCESQSESTLRLVELMQTSAWAWRLPRRVHATFALRGRMQMARAISSASGDLVRM
jgi:hypothetical protein